jgi:hypothetical protein
VSADEERALLLRRIVEDGYWPLTDQDGSTANTLLEMAEELAPMMGTTVPKTGTRRRWVRRWYHKLALRAKLRWFGLVPVIAILWATLEVRALVAQAPPTADSLYALPWVREAIGDWRPEWRVWCVTRWSDFGTLFLIVSVAQPDTVKQCEKPEGGSYPLLVTLPECPKGELVPVAAPFLLARCNGDGWIRFPTKRAVTPRTT